MNTPTPAQALADVLELRQIRDSRGPLGYVDHHLKFAQAAVTLVDEHGQHFAGLERDLEIVRGLRLAAAAELALANKRIIDLHRAKEEVAHVAPLLLELATSHECDTLTHAEVSDLRNLATFLATNGETK